MKMTGTFDFYFDLADQLQKLETEFILTIRPKGFEGCLTLSNVQSAQVAGYMKRSIEEMIEKKFNPNQDQGDGV